MEKGFAIGLHVPGTFDKIIDINECLLQPDAGNDLLTDVKNYIKQSAEPIYGLRSHDGFWRYVVLRSSTAYDEWMVNVVTASEKKRSVQPMADMLAEKYPRLVSIVNNITTRKAGIAVGEYEILLHGKSSIIDKIGPFDFEISANSFFQTNTRSAETLYQTVLDYCQFKGDETVFDLYSGTGAIAIYLSRYVKEVIGIEVVKSAIMDAHTNCRNNDVINCRSVQGDIQKCLPDIGKIPDAVIIDPPRSGMHKDVIRQVLEVGAKKIVYVSCNPTTMSRDIAMMKDSYDVKEVQPVDMFPHTYHIEAVCRLEKKLL